MGLLGQTHATGHNLYGNNKRIACLPNYKIDTFPFPIRDQHKEYKDQYCFLNTIASFYIKLLLF